MLKVETRQKGLAAEKEGACNASARIHRHQLSKGQCQRQSSQALLSKKFPPPELPEGSTGSFFSGLRWKTRAFSIVYQVDLPRSNLSIHVSGDNGRL